MDGRRIRLRLHGLKTWETGHLQSSIPSMSWNKTSNFDHTVLLAVTQISTLCEAFCNSYVHMNWYGSIWKPGVSTEFRLDIRDIRYEFTHVLHWINTRVYTEISDKSGVFAGGSMKLRKHEWRIAAAKRFAEPKVVTTLHPIRRKVAVHYVYYIRHWWV